MKSEKNIFLMDFLLEKTEYSKSKIKSLNSNEELDENKIKQYNDEFKDALKSDLVKLNDDLEYFPTKKVILSLGDSSVDKSVITDIFNRTPRTSTYADYCDIQRTGKL